MKKFQNKIEYSDQPRPRFMYALKDSNDHFWYNGDSGNFQEFYIQLFNTPEDAAAFRDKMEQDFCVHPSGEKVYWFKNRAHQVVKIDTTMKKYKSSYRPLSATINAIFQ